MSLIYNTSLSKSLFMKLLGQIRCRRYVRFAGAATTALVAVAELIMTMRVYALYLGSKKILYFLLFLVCGQVIASGWAVHNGMRVPQPPGFPGCVLTGKNSSFAALWGAPLVTDTCIFVLTLWKTATYLRRHGRMTTVEIMLRDGTLYFLTIFGVNLMNTLIYFLAQGDLKAVGASFSQILTSIMISRLQLNLRSTKDPKGRTVKSVFGNRAHNGTTLPSIVFTSVMAPSSGSSDEYGYTDDEKSFFTVGNLGGELGSSFETLGEGSSTITSSSRTAVDAESVELGTYR